MEHIKLPVGPMEANCYILFDESTREAGIIDPGADSGRIIDTIEENDLVPIYILLTHGHGDHIGDVEKLIQTYPDLKVVAHVDEVELLTDPSKNLSTMTCGRPVTAKVDVTVKDGDIIKIGEEEITVLHTPGHSPGGVVYLVGDKAFTGDTIFAGSIGRSDFYKGDQATLVHSIQSKLMTLDDKVELFTGHGPDTSVGREKLYNPYLK